MLLLIVLLGGGVFYCMDILEEIAHTNGYLKAFYCLVFAFVIFYLAVLIGQKTYHYTHFYAYLLFGFSFILLHYLLVDNLSLSLVLVSIMGLGMLVAVIFLVFEWKKFYRHNEFSYFSFLYFLIPLMLFIALDPSISPKVQLNTDLLKTTTLKDLIYGCDNNDSKACYELAEKYGQETMADNGKVLQTYEKSCVLENAKACYHLGLLYLNSEEVVQNYITAKDYFQKACDMGYGLGCNNLGVLLERGLGVAQDSHKAKDYYQKACDFREGLGCNNLGVLLQNDTNTTQNFEQARQYLTFACALENELGCYNLGMLYQNGIGVTQNTSIGQWYYNKACKLGMLSACNKGTE